MSYRFLSTSCLYRVYIVSASCVCILSTSCPHLAFYVVFSVVVRQSELSMGMNIVFCLFLRVRWSLRVFLAFLPLGNRCHAKGCVEVP